MGKRKIFTKKSRTDRVDLEVHSGGDPCLLFQPTHLLVCTKVSKPRLCRCSLLGPFVTAIDLRTSVPPLNEIALPRNL